MKTKLDDYIITYFEQTLLENLCPQCFFNTRIELDLFKKASIFNSSINYYKVTYAAILFTISFLLSLPWYFYIADVIIYLMWSFDPYYIHQNKTIKKSLKFIGISLLHSIYLLGKKERTEEILAFLQQNRPEIPVDQTHQNIKAKINKPVTYQFKFNHLINEKVELTDDALIEFANSFNKEYSKGLIRYIKERFNNNLSKKRDVKFLLALYLVPKRTTLSFETLQTISTILYKEFCHTELGSFALPFDPEQEIVFFNEYNEQQLKRLFSSNFTAKDYFTVLKNPDIVAPLFPNFDELNNFINKIHIDFKYPSKLMDKNTIIFNHDGNNYLCKIVMNVNNLVNLSKILSNCLSSKESKCLYADYVVYEISKNNEVYGAVAFNVLNSKLTISEIKGKANRELESAEKTAIVNEILKSYK